MTIRQAVSCAVALGCITAILKPTIGSQDGDLSTCSTRTGTVARAAQLYWSANNDRLPPAVSELKVECEKQQVFAMHVLPYHGSWMNYRCPADWATEHALNLDACNKNLTPPKSHEARIATWAQKSHRGYNHIMLAPIAAGSDVSAPNEPSYPVELHQIANPAKTIMLIDSINDRRSDGAPAGGGYWLVDPPCLRGTNFAKIMPLPSAFISYRWLGGWWVGKTASDEFGFAYPWHRNRFLVAMVDGSVNALSLDQLTAGCDAKPGSSGFAPDLDAFLWDIVK